jgi:diacylglycerol kinase (ATP)
MEQNKTMHIHSRKKSFAYAFNGLTQIVNREPNAKLHAAATIAAIVLALIRHIGQMQWVALFFAIGLVWITEALNTCIEKLCDLWCDNKYHPEIKIIKDMAAAAVLVAALVSVAIGIIIFIF